MTYRTKGTCSKEIIYSLDEKDCVKDVKFLNGCSGNAQGIARLVQGQHIDVVIAKLAGIKCRNNTSCPDQLALALTEYKQNKENA